MWHKALTNKIESKIYLIWIKNFFLTLSKKKKKKSYFLKIDIFVNFPERNKTFLKVLNY